VRRRGGRRVIILPMLRPAIPALLALAVAAPSASCIGPFACTLVGGYDGLFVELTVAGAPLPAGDYTLVARADGHELVAEIELVDQQRYGVSCTGCPIVVASGDHQLSFDPFLSSTDGDVTIGYLEAGAGGPATVTLELRRADVVLAQQTYEPRYERRQPNGSGCPPELHQAHDTLVITTP